MSDPTDMPKPWYKRVAGWSAETWFCVLFFLFLTLPIAVTMVGRRSRASSLLENRMLAPRPDFFALPRERWAKAFTDYYKDNNFYRNGLLGEFMRIHEWTLRSPLHYAVRSDDDWLFYFPGVRDHALGRPAGNMSVYAVRAKFHGFHQYLKKRGVYFILSSPPDKETMLAEKLPPWMSAARENGFFARLIPELERCGVPYLDLADSLRRSGRLEAMYNRLWDPTHWNARGVLHFYNAMADRLERDLGPAYRRANLGGKYELYEDWEDVRLLGIDASAIKARLVHPETLEARYRPLATPPRSGDRRRPSLVRNPALSSGRMVFVGDSFTQDSSVAEIPLAPDSEMPAHGPKTSPVTPFIFNVAEMVRIWQYDSSLAVMAELCDSFRPETVLYIECERGIRTVAADAQLYGEYLLGNLRLDLYRHFAENAEGGEAALTVGGDGGSVALPAIVLGGEGYGVVGGRMVSPAATEAVLSFRDERGAETVSVLPLAEGENILYFQLGGKPGETVQARFLPGRAAGRYAFLPFPFFDDGAAAGGEDGGR